MTQIVIPSQDILRTHNAREAVDSLLAALTVAETIPTSGSEASVISGQPTARFGALIRIDHEIRTGDPRGAWLLGATVGQTYCTPGDACTVVVRMLEEGREISGITAERGMLGGTTRA